MPWVKFTDDADENEKLGAVSDAAFRLWFQSIVWSNRNLKDGHIPTSRASRLCSMRKPEKTIAELVEAKLWHRASAPCASCVKQREEVKADQIPSGGYVIHHYFGDPASGAKYQKPRWVIEAERARLRSVGRTGGQKSGVVRSTQVKQTGSEEDDPNEADSFTTQVKHAGEADSFTPGASPSSFTPPASPPYSRTPVTPSSQSDSSRTTGGAGGSDPDDPPIPDDPPGTARKSSQRTAGMHHVGRVAAEITAGAGRA